MLLFPCGLRSCLPRVVEAVEEDELEDVELLAIVLRLLHADPFEFELEEVEPFAFGIIILILSTN